jgi:4'-phosphopantetheinyl transferase
VRSTLAPGEVHVRYRVTDTLEEADIASAAAMLSPDEHARYARLMFARDRRDYAAAHALLRTSLSQYAEVAPRQWTFRTDARGKPSLAADHDGSRLSFNLSHTHGLVACAVAGGADVGIDVESVDRVVDDRVARRFFSARENADLSRCASDALRARRFLALWTLKEAYVKAIGQGLSHPLNTIVFVIGDDDTIAFTPPSGVDARAWRFRLVAPTARHHLAVAVRQPDSAAVSILLVPTE